MEVQHGQALFAYFELSEKSGKARNCANFYDDVSNFFKLAAGEAESIWTRVVSGIKALAKWVINEVKILWESAVNAVEQIVDCIATFLKTYWNDVKEFVRRIGEVKDKVKDHIADSTLKVTDNLRGIAIGWIKDVLRKEGVDVDNISEPELRQKWAEYMESHPLTPQEVDEANDILNGPGAKTLKSEANYIKAGPLTAGDIKAKSEAYSREYIKARPLTAQEMAEADAILNG